MSKKRDISINLNLTEEELSQLYWMIYGTSLAKYTNVPKTNSGFTQLLQQMESFFIQNNPDSIFEIHEKKKKINRLIKAMD